jgi:hypothetical protein
MGGALGCEPKLIKRKAQVIGNEVEDISERIRFSMNTLHLLS